MTQKSYAVVLHGKPVGRIIQRGDVSRFVFSDGYWEDPERTVLGLWFEDDPRRSPQATTRLPVWFSNLLPDPDSPLRKMLASSQGVSTTRELMLLASIGNDLPGAVQVLPVDWDTVDPTPLNDVTSELASDQPSTLPWKFSLAGLQLKFSLLNKNSRLTIPASGTLGNWIIKLPSARYPEVPKVEYATMSLARSVGIDVPDLALLHRDELPPLPGASWANGEAWAFGTSRFDRTEKCGRVHIEDLAQVRGFYDSRKYEGTFDTVAGLIYRGVDNYSLREFVRRLTFNLLIGNGDAHLKNWSLIYHDRRTPTLSPAYDLVSTAPYFPDDQPDDFGLRLGGTKTMGRVHRGGFQRLQSRLGVGNRDVLDIVDETVAKFVQAWSGESRVAYPVAVGMWLDRYIPAVVSRLSP